ncbi:hypothetical protein P7C70_g9101, partial [Phenoliferia sp. Uapishka_3]
MDPNFSNPAVSLSLHPAEHRPVLDPNFPDFERLDDLWHSYLDVLRNWRDGNSREVRCCARQFLEIASELAEAVEEEEPGVNMCRWEARERLVGKTLLLPMPWNSFSDSPEEDQVAEEITSSLSTGNLPRSMDQREEAGKTEPSNSPPDSDDLERELALQIVFAEAEGHTLPQSVYSQYELLRDAHHPKPRTPPRKRRCRQRHPQDLDPVSVKARIQALEEDQGFLPYTSSPEKQTT